MKKMANSKHTIIGLLLFFWVCCFASPAKAQLVTIPDPVFRAWLEKSYYFKSCMQGVPGSKQLDISCNAVLTATETITNLINKNTYENI
jgi:hypothetical protein